MFEEDGHDVETLVDLTVSIDQVRVVHGKDVVDANVHVNPSQAVLVLEQWHFYSWHVAESPFLRNLLYDLSTVFDQLVLVVSHSAMKDNDDIDIGPTSCPQSINAGASG